MIGNIYQEHFFCLASGIVRQTTVLYNPEQNGVAKCKNLTIMECVRSLLKNAKLPNTFWAKAVSTAVYLQNRSLTNALNNKTLEEVWTGRKPSVTHLCVFGK